MQFTNKLDAIKFIVGLDDEAGTIDINISNEQLVSDVDSAPAAMDNVEESSKISIGSDEYVGHLSDDISENIIFVEACNVTPNSCGTGVIKFENRVLVLNMCQMNEETTVYLPTVIKGVSNHSTPFKVMISNGDEPNKILLAK